MSLSRQKYLDSLRGLAALIVVMTHFIGAFYPYVLFGNQGSYKQHAAWESVFIYPPFGIIAAGYFAVCLFFILSGYVLSYSFLGVKDCKMKVLAAIVKRPIRLGGLVLFTVLIGSYFWYCGLFYNSIASEITWSQPWFRDYWKGDFHVLHLLRNITTALFTTGMQYNPPLWTMKLELNGSMLIFAFILLFGNMSYRFIVQFILLVYFHNTLYQGFIFGIIIADLVKNYPLDISGRYKSLFNSIGLVLGVFFASYPQDVSAKIISMPMYRVLPKISLLGGGYPMLGALIIFVLVITNKGIKDFLVTRPLEFLGRISYALYAVHFLIIGTLSSWIFLHLSSLLSYGLSFSIMFIISMLVIIATSYYTTEYIDNTAINVASRIGQCVNRLLEVLVNSTRFQSALERIKSLRNHTTS